MQQPNNRITKNGQVFDLIPFTLLWCLRNRKTFFQKKKYLTHLTRSLHVTERMT